MLTRALLLISGFCFVAVFFLLEGHNYKNHFSVFFLHIINY